MHADQERKRSSLEPTTPTPHPRHPYLSGNFAPIQHTLALTQCSFTGEIPPELGDGEYVRNGSNPVSNDDLGRAAHWFDGDGMLAGVLFRRDAQTGAVQPEFVNQYILTDLYLSTLASPHLKTPILPSIATLVNPVTSFIYMTVRILRTVLLVLLSHLPGSTQKIKRISVANTSVVYHDGRALATCESGPPMRIQLPGLETVGWYNGAYAEGEAKQENVVGNVDEKVLGGDAGLLSFMREWTTAHPKVDPHTKEMMMFHSSFAPPYVQYSIVPQSPAASLERTSAKKILNAAIPGITSAKMMHDFGVSLNHTIIMDLPLSLDPLNQLKGKPPVTYDSSKPSRFGVFPRRRPQDVQWFETDACCIFHTANTWDDENVDSKTETVSMLACRLTSATLVFAAGNIAPPVERVHKRPVGLAGKRKRMPFFSKYSAAGDEECHTEAKEPLLHITEPSSIVDCAGEEKLEDQCRLYYYNFSLSTNHIRHQWALSTIPFEFPSVRPDLEMQRARYIYGCSTITTSFGAALGKATKIDALVKFDATTLIARGHARPPRSVSGAVDTRSMAEILASQSDPNEPIKVFRMPEGWYAQEPRFVPASSAEKQEEEEDAGYLLFYAFDESQLLSTSGDVPSDADPTQRARSQLWIIDARDMRTVVARVQLPQRVPYGLHGTWFSKDQIEGQRSVDTLREVGSGHVKEANEPQRGRVWPWKAWMSARSGVERWLA